jgi:hypothetical protein
LTQTDTLVTRRRPTKLLLCDIFCLRLHARAVCTAPRLGGNAAQAFGAHLRGGLRWRALMHAVQLIDGNNHNKVNRRGGDQELDEVINEIAIQELAAMDGE